MLFVTWFSFCLLPCSVTEFCFLWIKCCCICLVAGQWPSDYVFCCTTPQRHLVVLLWSQSVVWRSIFVAMISQGDRKQSHYCNFQRRRNRSTTASCFIYECFQEFIHQKCFVLCFPVVSVICLVMGQWSKWHSLKCSWVVLVAWE